MVSSEDDAGVIGLGAGLNRRDPMLNGCIMLDRMCMMLCSL